MSSAERLREHLACMDAAAAWMNDALYHVQIRYTCDLLDVVDEAADPDTAKRITDAICERLAGSAATEAFERIAQARKDYEALVRRPG
jgi:hypothetical protein